MSATILYRKFFFFFKETLFFFIAVRFIEFLKLFFQGETNRAIAAHSLNKQSSRSHCIFTVYLEVSLLSLILIDKE